MDEKKQQYTEEEKARLVDEYSESKRQLDIWKDVVEANKKRLQEMMLAEGIDTAEGTLAQATLVRRESIKFDGALLPYLKKNGYDTYVIEAVDETALKKAMKSSEIMRAELSKYTSSSESYAITIKVQ